MAEKLYKLLIKYLYYSNSMDLFGTDFIPGSRIKSPLTVPKLIPLFEQRICISSDSSIAYMLTYSNAIYATRLYSKKYSLISTDFDFANKSLFYISINTNNLLMVANFYDIYIIYIPSDFQLNNNIFCKCSYFNINTLCAPYTTISNKIIQLSFNNLNPNYLTILTQPDAHNSDDNSLLLLIDIYKHKYDSENTNDSVYLLPFNCISFSYIPSHTILSWNSLSIFLLSDYGNLYMITPFIPLNTAFNSDTFEEFKNFSSVYNNNNEKINKSTKNQFQQYKDANYWLEQFAFKEVPNISDNNSKDNNIIVKVKPLSKNKNIYPAIQQLIEVNNNRYSFISVLPSTSPSTFIIMGNSHFLDIYLLYYIYPIFEKQQFQSVSNTSLSLSLIQSISFNTSSSPTILHSHSSSYTTNTNKDSNKKILSYLATRSSIYSMDFSWILDVINYLYSPSIQKDLNIPSNSNLHNISTKISPLNIVQHNNNNANVVGTSLNNYDISSDNPKTILLYTHEQDLKNTSNIDFHQEVFSNSEKKQFLPSIQKSVQLSEEQENFFKYKTQTSIIKENINSFFSEINSIRSKIDTKIGENDLDKFKTAMEKYIQILNLCHGFDSRLQQYKNSFHKEMEIQSELLKSVLNKISQLDTFSRNYKDKIAKLLRIFHLLQQRSILISRSHSSSPLSQEYCVMINEFADIFSQLSSRLSMLNSKLDIKFEKKKFSFSDDQIKTLQDELTQETNSIEFIVNELRSIQDQIK